MGGSSAGGLSFSGQVGANGQLCDLRRLTGCVRCHKIAEFKSAPAPLRLGEGCDPGEHSGPERMAPHPRMLQPGSIGWRRHFLTCRRSQWCHFAPKDCSRSAVIPATAGIHFRNLNQLTLWYNAVLSCPPGHAVAPSPREECLRVGFTVKRKYERGRVLSAAQTVLGAR